MVKAELSNTKVTPHGGIIPILKKIKEYGIPQVIRSTLGIRKKQSRYGYDDVFIAWVLTSLCGGTRLEHISKLREKLNIIPGLKLPSHDTLGRVFKAMATDTITSRSISRESKAKISFSEYNDNLLLNEMLIKATKRIGALTENRKYTLHIDATFIPTNCSESKLSYGKEYGFYPMVCCIDETPVFISMRNGNVSPRFQVSTCLKQCLELLAKNNIKIGKVISDSAAYSKDFMEMLHEMNIKFVIRPKMTKNTSVIVNEFNDWQPTEIRTTNSFWQCDVGDIPFSMFESETKLRLVVLRFESKYKKVFEDEDDIENNRVMVEWMKRLRDQNLLKPKKDYGKPKTMGKKIGGYAYKFFITSDFSKTAEEIVVEYNKRGGFEKKFDYLKNDWGWKVPPFSKMSPNGVFFIAAALANNIFRGVVKQIKKVMPGIRLNSRLKDFQFLFIDVSCSLIDKTYHFHSKNIAYVKLME